MATFSSAARDAYDLSFQVSPIFLTGGLAQGLQGGILPVIALLGQAAGLLQGVVTSGFSMSDFNARFVPMPGASVISNTVGTYPFANQYVAANAIVQQPLNVSLQMITPIKDLGGYLTKLAIFTSFQQSLASHNAAGGTYTIATPSYIYTGCIMTGMNDITSGETRQQQIIWQLDFVQPLVSLNQAQNAQSALMSKLSGGQTTGGLWTAASGNAPGSELAIGQAAGGLSQFVPNSVPL